MVKHYVKDRIYDYLMTHAQEFVEGIDAQTLSKRLNIQRSNLSSHLNTLVREGKLTKHQSRPVKFYLRDLEQQETTCFQYLVGHQTVLKNSVHLIKASLVYPDFGLACLLVGGSGTGKSYIAQLMHRFAQEEGLLAKDSKLIRINCLHHFLQDATVKSIRETLAEASGHFVYIDHLDVLNTEDRAFILSKTEQQNRNFFLVCSIDSHANDDLLRFLTTKFPLMVHLPDLDKLPFADRFNLVRHFLQNEAIRFDKTITLNAEILRNLLLYPCPDNIKQLKHDIRLACARAYLRDFEQDSRQLVLYMQDFSADVHKGFMFYPEHRVTIEQIIPQNFSYHITKQGLKSTEERQLFESDISVHTSINQRVDFLRNQGLSLEHIQTVLIEEIEASFQQLHQQIDQQPIEKTALITVAGQQLTSQVEAFLEQFSHQFHYIYHQNLLALVTLFLYSTLQGTRFSFSFTDEQGQQITSQRTEEYRLVVDFIQCLGQELQYPFSQDDCLYLLILLTESHPSKQRNDPSVQLLLAMHGEATARSIISTVQAMVPSDHIHYYDLNLTKDLKVVYEELRRKILDIDQGKGILLMYDMGSLKAMADTISQELGIAFQTIALPVTLIALEAARNLTPSLSLSQFYQENLSLISRSFQLNSQLYQRLTAKKVVITLCLTGEGAALSMKHYLERYGDLDNTDILPLSLNDRAKLTEEITAISKEHDIIAIIGTYDPKIIGIPFITAHQLYQTRKEQVPQLLVDPRHLDHQALAYSDIYHYLKEQQPSLNISRLKRTLPHCLRQIRKLRDDFSKSKETGLFIHLACLISNLQQGKLYPELPDADRLLRDHQDLYQKLRDILIELEYEFDILIPEAEYASIIRAITEF